jgi:hypothetical protein
VSQPTSAGLIDVVPEGTFQTRVGNLELATFLQLRGGLNISAGKAVYDAAEAAGEAANRCDRTGTIDANDGEHRRRHDGTLNKAYDMVVAVAIGQVVKGDKENKERMAQLNEGTITDLCEVEGDEETGADVHFEVKVVSPCTQKGSAGRGSRAEGGKPESVGHLYAFGNTEERLRVGILGIRGMGRKKHGPLNHYTGRGWVQAQPGKYRHALAQGARVCPLITETTGAVSPRSLVYVAHLARRARGKHGRDGTRYGALRRSASSFYIHHTQRISRAAALGNVKGLLDVIRSRKQALAASARAAAAGGRP